MDGDLTVSINIKHPEGCLKALTRQEGVLVERGHQEFGVVDLAVTVDVNFLDDLLDLLLVVVDALDLAKGQFDFVGRKGATAVLVKLFELLSQVVELLLSEHGLDKEAEHRLLNFCVPCECLQIIQCLREVQILQVTFLSHLEPGVLKSFSSTWSVLWVNLKETLDEIASLR